MNLLLKINYCLITLMIFLIVGSSVVTADQAKANMPETVKVNGATIQYVEQGSGPLMILAHGALSNYKTWVKRHMPLLAQHFRVVSFSMRYHGSNQWDDSWPPLTVDLYADDLAGLIKSFNAGPAHLVGWSMGSRVVHATSLKYPDLVRSAYLFEGVVDMVKSPEEIQEEKELWSKLTNPVLTAHKSGDHIGAVRALLDGVGGKVGIFDGMPEPNRKFLSTRANVLVEYLGRKKHEPTAYECDQIRRSKVPTTLVMGTASVEYFQTVTLKHSLPCFGEERVTWIADAGHLWPGGSVEQFAASVTEFALKH